MRVIFFVKIISMLLLVILHGDPRNADGRVSVALLLGECLSPRRGGVQSFPCFGKHSVDLILLAELTGYGRDIPVAIWLSC